jgi:hypothetical protein
MSLGSWLRRLFASADRDDEAAEREEYGLRDRGEAELERERLGSRFPRTEGAETAREELDSLERPPDPNP